MKIGYARVSTYEQNLDRQIEQLEQNQCSKIYCDKASGKDTSREQLNEMLSFIREQDEIVVVSLDRLGRDYDDIKSLLDFCNKKHVKVTILDAPFLNFNTGNDTLDKALFDMLTSLLGYISENERKKMLERQAQGIAIAKQKGVYKGKQVEYSPNAKDKKKRAVYFGIVQDLQDNHAVKTIATKYGVTRTLVYRIKKEHALSV